MMSKLKDLHRSIIRSYKALIANDNSWRVNGYAQGDKAKVCKSGKKRNAHFSQKVKAWPKAFLDVKNVKVKSSYSFMKTNDISQNVCLIYGKWGHRNVIVVWTSQT